MSKKKDLIGISIKEAKNKLYELLTKREEILNEVASEKAKAGLAPDAVYIVPPLLSARMKNVNDEIDRILEWYTVNLLESLDNESKRLNTLTKVLIIATVILLVLTLMDIVARLMIHA